VSTFRTILALYVLVWFTAVVPAHTRGIVSLRTGADDGASHVDGCCAGASERAPDGTSSPDRSSKSKSTCAVCYVAATYASSAPLVIDLAPGGEVTAWLQVPRAGIPHSRPLMTYFPTGPPHTEV
jgi:hypothetical protein